MTDSPNSQCVLAEKEFAVMAGQVEMLVRTVDKLTVAIMGNGKPGIVSELSAIKAHIGFNQQRTIHERMTTIEDILKEMRDEKKQSQNDIKSIILPIVRELIVFAGGGLTYIFITYFIK